MAFEGKINGHKVKSDKELHSVVNSKVTFEDGSWCNVDTGEVHNVGRGYIDIDSDSKKGSSKPTKITKTFMASALEVRDTEATLEIQPHDGNTIEVVVTGPEDDVKSVKFSESGKTLTIEGGETGSSFSSVTRISSVRGGPVSIRGGLIVGKSIVSIGDFSGSESEIKVSVKVPKGTPISLENAEGEVAIGNIEGPLQATCSGNSDITAGSVTDTNVSLSGQGDVTIAAVNGSLTVNVSGQGSVNVRRGKVSTLNVNLSGQGDVDFGGEAESAVLVVSGMGDINVRSVKNRPTRSVSGMGDIEVGNW